MKDVERYLSAPTAQDTPVMLFTRFDPAEVKPVGEVVKVRGSMRAEPGEPGELRVVTDYTFVHPVTPTKGGTDVQRTIVRRQVTLSLLDPARWETTRGRLQLHTYSSEWSNVECEAADGFLHPQFAGDALPGPQPTGPAVDPYDRSREIRAKKGAGRSPGPDRRGPAARRARRGLTTQRGGVFSSARLARYVSRMADYSSCSAECRCCAPPAGRTGSESHSTRRP